VSEISEAAESLSGAWSGLCGRWHDAREHWRDAIGDSFERRLWQEWEAEMPQLLRALNDLNEVLSQAVEHTE
jgi:hypothetical protein